MHFGPQYVITDKYTQKKLYQYVVFDMQLVMT